MLSLWVWVWKSLWRGLCLCVVVAEIAALGVGLFLSVVEVWLSLIVEWGTGEGIAIEIAIGAGAVYAGVNARFQSTECTDTACRGVESEFGSGTGDRLVMATRRWSRSLPIWDREPVCRVRISHSVKRVRRRRVDRGI